MTVFLDSLRTNSCTHFVFGGNATARKCGIRLAIVGERVFLSGLFMGQEVFKISRVELGRAKEIFAIPRVGS